MWVLERQGKDNDIRKYSLFGNAQYVMNLEYNKIVKGRTFCAYNDLSDNYAEIGDEEYYQAWYIYEEKSFDNPIEAKLNEIQMELDRTDIGVTQYAYELMDTCVIRDHLYEVDKLINELKEMI